MFHNIIVKISEKLNKQKSLKICLQVTYPTNFCVICIHYTFQVGRPCVCPSVRFSFPDDSLSKHHWIFTKPGMCIDIVEIWFGIVMANFVNFLVLSARDTPIFSFPDDNLSKHQWNLTKLATCIDIVEIWFGIANG